jgi:hypothetical protein
MSSNKKGMDRGRKNVRFGKKEVNSGIKNVRTPTPTTTSFKVDTWEDYDTDEDLALLGRVFILKQTTPIIV